MKTGQREKQMTQNNHQRHQKPQKQHSQKNIKKKHEFFTIFDNKGLSRMSLEAQDVHNDSPTEIRPQKKETKIKDISFQYFETKQNKQIWTPKHQTKKNRK